ncbi:unnamed protein product [Urochloa humidicola]
MAVEHWQVPPMVGMEEGFDPPPAASFLPSDATILPPLGDAAITGVLGLRPQQATPQKCGTDSQHHTRHDVARNHTSLQKVPAGSYYNRATGLSASFSVFENGEKATLPDMHPNSESKDESEHPNGDDNAAQGDDSGGAPRRHSEELDDHQRNHSWMLQPIERWYLGLGTCIVAVIGLMGRLMPPEHPAASRSTQQVEDSALKKLNYIVAILVLFAALLVGITTIFTVHNPSWHTTGVVISYICILLLVAALVIATSECIHFLQKIKDALKELDDVIREARRVKNSLRDFDLRDASLQHNEAGQFGAAKN